MALAVMAMAAALPAKPAVASSSLRSHWKGMTLLSPRPLMKMPARFSSNLRLRSLCVRSDLSDQPILTEPEIMPGTESAFNATPQYGEQGEVTEAEFTEVSEEVRQAAGPYADEGGYDASQYAEGNYGEEGNEEEEYDQSQYGQYADYDQSQYQGPYYQNPEQSQYSAANVEEQAPAEPPPHYDNFGKLMKFIAVGRAMQLKLDTQKDFERFLDHCNAYGVMIPEKPSDIKRNLCELDPKETWIVVDSRAVLKFAKKLALEEAERNKDDYPPGFVENMLNRDKYGRYKSDDD